MIRAIRVAIFIYIYGQSELSMTINTVTLAEQLRRMEMFSVLPEPVLQELAQKSTIVHAAAGEVIFHKNQPARSLYLILSGSAKVHDNDYTVADMQEGACFGELALLDEGPRSMSVTATTPTILLRIDRSAFFDAVGHTPELLQKIVSVLTRRLRFQTEQRLEELQRREAELTRLVEERTAELMRQKEEAEALRAKAEAETREAEFQRRRAEQSERSEQQFLANMSHEIRTPMNAVIGMTKLLLQKDPRENQLRYLLGIQQSSEALLVILNDILDISKVQAGRMELEWTTLHLATILDNVRATLQFRAEEKGLGLDIYYDPAIPSALRGDPVRLQQILLNLAGNAVKFTEKGEVNLMVRLDEQQGRRCQLHFEVRDSGIGMNPEQLAVVFESFRQASGETTRKYGGTGLGLSISKQLTELFGGRIEVESSPGVGSTFHVYLSLDIAAHETDATAALDPDAAKALSGLRILIVEDNVFNRLVAVETLEMLITGLRIVNAENGLEALEAVQRETFDVVLMDVSMPVMDGLEATRAIRALPPPFDVLPIIAFTASVTKNEINNCLAAGMNGCIPKPFQDAELIGALCAVVLQGNRLAAHVPNPAVLNRLAAGKPERLRKYLNMYLDAVEHSIPKIERAMEAGERENLHRIVHTLKPQLKLVGLDETAILAQTLETQILEGEAWDSLSGLAGNLLAALRQSVKDVGQMLDI